MVTGKQVPDNYGEGVEDTDSLDDVGTFLYYRVKKSPAFRARLLAGLARAVKAASQREYNNPSTLWTCGGLFKIDSRWTESRLRLERLIVDVIIWTT